METYGDIKIKALNKEFVIHFVEDMNSMKLALQEEGAHVLFMGHSNYGLGPVFATSEEITQSIY